MKKTPPTDFRILAIDPGPSTGLASLSSDNPTVPWAATMQRIPAEDFIVEKIPLATVVICETFVISQATTKKSRAGSESIEMIGLVRYQCRIHGIPLVESAPSDVMRFATDDKLRRIGWYVTGPDHARDALRHLLTYCAENRIVNPIQLLPRSD